MVLVSLCTPMVARADTSISLALSGWGWCPAYLEIANVTLNLDGSIIPRTGAPEVADLYLAGILEFNLGDRTDNFAVELRGTKVRSVFFLGEVTGGAEPLIAEFEGTWLGETNYVATEGRLAVPVPNHVANAYVFVLRTTDTAIPAREPGGWVGNWDFIMAKSTSAFDQVATRITQSGGEVKSLLGEVLTEVTAILVQVRALGTPYFP